VTAHDAYGARPPRRRPEETGLSRRSFLRLRRTPAARADIDFDGATARVAEAWERGDPSPWLRAIEPVAAVVAEAAALDPGQQVLDVGAGDGNVALACAAAGAEVDACDLSAAMVERGRARCGRSVAWRRADAQALPYPDASFDTVVSAFGAPLAPRARRTARELVRVCRPGGRVVIAAWIARGLPGSMPELVETVDPLPDGVPSPASWGSQDVVRERLGPLLEELELRTRTVELRFPSPDALFAALAPATLDDAGRSRIRPDFDRLLAAQNNRPPGAVVDGRYLLACGRRPSA
jgi:SAM-dependent methyltransferase